MIIDDSMYPLFQSSLDKELNEYIKNKYVSKKDETKRNLQILLNKKDIEYFIIEPFKEISSFSNQSECQKQVIGIVKEVDHLNNTSITYKIVVTGVFLYRAGVPKGYKFVFTTYKEKVGE